MTDTAAPTARAFGFTLIEMMIALAVLAIVAGIAVPIYQGYVREARLGVARNNMESLRIYLEDWRLDNNTYDVSGTGSFNPETVAGLGWTADGDQDRYTYLVTASSTSFDVLARWAPDPNEWVLCERRMVLCCDDDSGVSTSSCD